MTKKPQHRDCTRVRRMLIKHGTLPLNGDAVTMTHQEWVTKPCGVPLFGDEARASGLCRGCASGWTHPENYPVDEAAP